MLRNLLGSVPPQPLVLQTISSCFHPQTAHSQPSLLQASRVLSTRVNPPEAAWRSRQEPPTRTGWLQQAGEGKPSATDGPKGQENPHTPSKSNEATREEFCSLNRGTQGKDKQAWRADPTLPYFWTFHYWPSYPKLYLINPALRLQA